MAKQKDVFGFDELEKAIEKMESKYDEEADAYLAAMANQAAKRLRQISPKVTGNLKKAYGTQRPKEYKGGTVKVSRVRNRAQHAHLFEYGHKVLTTGGRKLGKLAKYNSAGLKAMGVKTHGRVEGRFHFDKVWNEMEKRVKPELEKLLKKVTKDLEV